MVLSLSHQALHHSSVQLSIFQHSSLHHSILLHSARCLSCCCRSFRAGGSSALALQPAGRGLQWGAERTRGSTPPSVPAPEAEAATVRQEVRSVLRQRRRPRVGVGGAPGLSGPLRCVKTLCLPLFPTFSQFSSLKMNKSGSSTSHSCTSLTKVRNQLTQYWKRVRRNSLIRSIRISLSFQHQKHRADLCGVVERSAVCCSEPVDPLT